MPPGPKLWIRHETYAREHRAPLAPADARALVRAGVSITVEESAERRFDLDSYRRAGCRTAPAGSWPRAPRDHYIVGLKALPPEPRPLAHRHVYFGHAFKGQAGAGTLLDRFVTGGGELLDLEYLIGDHGRRLAAFGYWAGYAGAALAVLRHRDALAAPLRPTTKAELDDALRLGAPPARPAHSPTAPAALVIGALGRCGTGARDALAVAGIRATCWDIEETRRLDRTALLAHDLLVNAVYRAEPGPVFLGESDLDASGRRLAVIADVACDVGSDCNVLPIYGQPTTWERPWVRLREARPAGTGPLDLIAIDNLPSLLPAESTTDFSAQLAPLLARLAPDPTAGQTAPEWRRCTESFHGALAGAAGFAARSAPRSAVSGGLEQPHERKEHVDA